MLSISSVFTSSKQLSFSSILSMPTSLFDGCLDLLSQLINCMNTNKKLICFTSLFLYGYKNKQNTDQ